MHAIPTKYKGVQFRSRLEARWAAFFDLVGCEWQYEPFDLNGYIPDFLLGGRLLCEVRPIVWKNYNKEPREIAERAWAAGWPSYKPVISLGVNHNLRGHHMGFMLGVAALRQSDEFCYTSHFAVVKEGAETTLEAHSPDHAVLVKQLGMRWVAQPDKHTKYHSDDVPDMQAWPGRFVSEQITHLWNQAGNLVQWKGVQACA